MTAHTPGPWFIARTQYNWLFIVENPIPTDWPARDLPDYVEIIAKIEPGEKADANARLIAKAWMIQELPATLRDAINIMRAAEDEIRYERRRVHHEHVIEMLERIVAIADEPPPPIDGEETT